MYNDGNFKPFLLSRENRIAPRQVAAWLGVIVARGVTVYQLDQVYTPLLGLLNAIHLHREGRIGPFNIICQN